MIVKFLAKTIYEEVVESVKEFASGIMDQEAIIISAAVFLAVIMIISSIVAFYAYESRLNRSIKKLNNFFIKNPYVNDDNLVVLNNMLKKVPKTLRSCWQEYMINRDKLPSEYMSIKNCLDKAERAGGYNLAITIASVISGIVISIFSLLNLANVVAVYGSSISVIEGLLRIFLLPLIMISIVLIFIAIFKLKQNTQMSDLYYNFNDFMRSINKACSTMPSYVDYELLFTQKEIRDGIPVLQEYLEKKAFQEQKEAEEAALEGNNFEQFDFEELGVENSILLDRAMLECEKYFNAKRSLTEKSNAKEQELYNFSKNFDEVTKDYERKAQSHRENMAQLNEQLNNTTIKIEANYIKKRYNEEQQKLQQLEKDYDLAVSRFKKQQEDLENEVKAINDQMAEKKSAIEEAMKSEGKSYANKIYGIINKMVADQNAPYFKEVEEQKASLQEQINSLSQTLAVEQSEVASKQSEIENLEHDLKLRLAQIEAIGNVKEYFSSKEFRDRVIEGKKYKKEENVPENFENVDELKMRLANAEEQLKNATQKQQEMVVRENQLMEKLQAIESNKNQLQEENISLQNKQKASLEKIDKLTELTGKIQEENTNYLNSKKELQKTMGETLSALSVRADKAVGSNKEKLNSSTNKVVVSPEQTPRKSSKSALNDLILATKNLKKK